MQLEPAISAGRTEAPTPPLPVRRIQPSRGLFRIDLRELWRFRELLVFLMWRDIKARYRQTILGGAWALLRPFISMVVFTIFINRVAGISAGNGIPYPLFVFPGLLLWNYFTSGLGGGATGITGNAVLVTRASFPRIHLVLGAIIAPIVDFMLSLVTLAAVFLFYHRAPSWRIVFLPALLLLTVVLVLGMSLWLAPLTVRYRDIPFLLPFVLQLWMFLTPVLYPASILPPRYSWLLKANPVSGLALGTRWSLVGGPGPSAELLGISIGFSAFLLVTGLAYFQREEPIFPDIV